MVIHGDLPQEKNTLETQRNMVIYPTETRRKRGDLMGFTQEQTW